MPIYKINESTLPDPGYGDELYVSHERFKGEKIILYKINNDESIEYKNFLINLDLFKKQYNSILNDIAKDINKKSSKLDIKNSNDMIDKLNLTGLVYANKNFILSFSNKPSKITSNISIDAQVVLKNDNFHLLGTAI